MGFAALNPSYRELPATMVRRRPYWLDGSFAFR